MKYHLDVSGFEDVMRTLNARGRIHEAAAQALTWTAYNLNDRIKEAMNSTFKGGATPYSLRAFRVYPAKAENLTATVWLRDDAPGKGQTWEVSLSHLFTGGARQWKRMENLFRRIRALPSGWIMVPPGKGSWAIQLDSYGNPPRGLITQLISYFSASTEQGYAANMSDKRRASLAKVRKNERGYKTINGVQYFISWGKAGRPGGDRYVHGRFSQHLAPGIWARRGVHGVDVAPVFLFVKMGAWRKTIDLDALGAQVAGDDLERLFAKAMARGSR